MFAAEGSDSWYAKEAQEILGKEFTVANVADTNS
jgi:hypothetical protein